MYREYVKEPGVAVSRPRGKSPQQCAFFTRSPKLKEESSLLASLCSPAWRAATAQEFQLNRRDWPTFHAANCYAKPLRSITHLVADHAPSVSNTLVFLVTALAEGEELTLASCEDCGALTVVDRMSFKGRHCQHCVNRVD